MVSIVSSMDKPFLLSMWALSKLAPSRFNPFEYITRSVGNSGKTFARLLMSRAGWPNNLCSNWNGVLSSFWAWIESAKQLYMSRPVCVAQV